MLDCSSVPKCPTSSEMYMSGERATVYVGKAGNVFIVCLIIDVAFCMGTKRKLAV